MIGTKPLLELQKITKGCFLWPEWMIFWEGESFLSNVFSDKDGCLHGIAHLVNDVHMAVPRSTRETCRL